MLVLPFAPDPIIEGDFARPRKPYASHFGPHFLNDALFQSRHERLITTYKIGCLSLRFLLHRSTLENLPLTVT